MKFKSKIKINTSLDYLVCELTNPSNMSKWMRGFESYELIDGNMFEKGAQAIIYLNILGKKMELKETIIHNDLPNSFQSKYEAQGVTSYITNRFEEIDAQTSIWYQQQEFRFKSLSVKLLSPLVLKIFKSFSDFMLQDFKKFIEKES